MADGTAIGDEGDVGAVFAAEPINRLFVGNGGRLIEWGDRPR
jgi:hypothetical protein